MNTGHALHKPVFRPPEALRPRSEPARSSPVTSPVSHDPPQDFRGEIRDESERFEQLLAPLDCCSPPSAMEYGYDNFSDRQDQHSREGSGQQSGNDTPMANPRTAALWDALLVRLEENLMGQDTGPLEAHFELPNLGQVTAMIQIRGDGLQIALHFEQDSAMERCQSNRAASEAWLSRQLGRSVNLFIHHPVY